MHPGEHSDNRTQEILTAQTRLLYANANVGVLVTLVVATVLATLEWSSATAPVATGWWCYMVALAVWRFLLARRYRRAETAAAQPRPWLLSFAVGAGLAGTGWGAAAVLLYPTRSTNQVFLAFCLGGMMLGAAWLLAARPEAFLAFLLPTGLAQSVRLMLQGDEAHVAMGLLCAVFTVAVVFTTWRIHLSLESFLRLQFLNRDLVEELQRAQAALEQRVRERTAELEQSAEQLRREIDQRRQVEEELLRARKLESLGVLAGGIAHDFNNFLTVVMGNLELLRKSLGPRDPLHAILDEAAGASHRAAFLASQLLTFAKGGAPVRRVVSMAKLVREAVQLARSGNSISVETHIPEDLPYASVDPGQIGQVLHNILLNAQQAMPEGGIVEVRAENPEDAAGWIRIAVRDYGCGIPAEMMPRIFDPYVTSKPGSSGLGLATAYAIVKKHGGRLSAESQPGRGSEFVIELPASRETPEPEEPPAPAVQEGGRERLLVMDDEPALRKLLKTVLAGMGYQVETAADGAEAIALYERERAAGRAFDAVLLDLTVSGGMGGIETAARLKELDPEARLIVSSGYSDAPVMSDFASYGFRGVIPKPWSAEELSAAIRRVLSPDPDRARD